MMAPLEPKCLFDDDGLAQPGGDVAETTENSMHASTHDPNTLPTHAIYTWAQPTTARTQQVSPAEESFSFGIPLLGPLNTPEVKKLSVSGIDQFVARGLFQWAPHQKIKSRSKAICDHARNDAETLRC